MSLQYCTCLARVNAKLNYFASEISEQMHLNMKTPNCETALQEDYDDEE